MNENFIISFVAVSLCNMTKVSGKDCSLSADLSFSAGKCVQHDELQKGELEGQI